jgi:hypothetical protein
VNAGEIHRVVQEAFNAGDRDALIALYEEDAAMATPEASSVVERPSASSGRGSSHSEAPSPGDAARG